MAVGGARAGAATNSWGAVSLYHKIQRLCPYQSGIADKLSCQPEERFLEVVVGLSRDIVVLQILLSMESDSLSLNLSFLNVNLVAGEDDRDILADTDQVT